MIQSKIKIAGFVAACISLSILIGTVYAATTPNAALKTSNTMDKLAVNTHRVYSNPVVGVGCKGITNTGSVDFFVPTGPSGSGSDFTAFLASTFAGTNATKSDCLYGGNHDRSECTGTGALDSTNTYCIFNLPACPAGWLQYGTYQQWAQKTCPSTNAGLYCDPTSNSAIIAYCAPLVADDTYSSYQACFDVVDGSSIFGIPINLPITGSCTTPSDTYDQGDPTTCTYRNIFFQACDLRTCTADTRAKIGCY